MLTSIKEEAIIVDEVYTVFKVVYSGLISDITGSHDKV